MVADCWREILPARDETLVGLDGGMRGSKTDQRLRGRMRCCDPSWWDATEFSRGRGYERGWVWKAVIPRSSIHLWRTLKSFPCQANEVMQPRRIGSTLYLAGTC